MPHSLEDMFYKPSPTSLLEILQKIASDSQKAKYASTTNDLRNKTLPVCKLVVPFNPHAVAKTSLNCDGILAVIPEGVQANQLDSISTVTSTNDLDEDTFSNESSSSHTERHFRRRKRRSSLTKTPSADGENPTFQFDSIEKLDDNNNTLAKPQEEISPLPAIECLSLEEKQQNEQTTTSLHRLRGRSESFQTTTKRAPLIISFSSLSQE